MPKIIIFLVFIITADGCRHAPISKKTSTGNNRNFKISWSSDSSFLLLEKSLKKKITVVSQPLIINTRRKSTSSKKVINKPDILLSTDTILYDDDIKKIFNKTIIPGVEHASLFQIGSSDKYNIVNVNVNDDKPLNGFAYSSNQNIKEISLHKLGGESARFFLNDSINIIIDSCRFHDIYFTSKYDENKFSNDTTVNLKNWSTVNLTINNKPKLQSQELVIEYKKLGVIEPGNTKTMSVSVCYVSNSKIDCYGVDKLQLDAIYFKDSKEKLILKSYYTTIIKGNFVLPSDISLNHHTLLFLRDFDAKRLDLDYQFFKYIPDNEYLKTVKNFGEIIAFQKANSYQEGFRSAHIDSAEFEDKQHFVTTIFIPIKIWWNNYGLDKVKVVNSTLELFIGIWIINSIFFRKLLVVYSFSEIKVEKEISNLSRNKFKQLLFGLYLSLLYSGYLFFGLKFDINKLKIKHVVAVVWIISQYVAGIVSLGFIANLIITR